MTNHCAVMGSLYQMVASQIRACISSFHIKAILDEINSPASFAQNRKISTVVHKVIAKGVKLKMGELFLGSYTKKRHFQIRFVLPSDKNKRWVQVSNSFI